MMAKHFLETPKSTSNQRHPESRLDPMVFPAYCNSTEEHTIIMGHTLQLGDSKIRRKMASIESEPDKIETRVTKMRVYKDQLEMDWEGFVTAPVRHLLQMIEAMQLCRSQQCGVERAKIHPGLDEALDAVIMDVWSRSFLDEQGKGAKPS